MIHHCDLTLTDETLWPCDHREQRGDLSHAGGRFGETLPRLGETLAYLPSLLQLGFPQCVDGLGVGTQFSADLRHVTVGTGCQHASSGSICACSGGVRAGEDSPLAKPSLAPVYAGAQRSVPRVLLRRDDNQTDLHPTD